MLRLPLAALLLAQLPAQTAARAQGRPAFPVVDGDRRAVIVGAGHTLRTAIEKCTGVSLRVVVRESKYRGQPGEYAIYVGETDKARQALGARIESLDVEGYIFLVEPDCAVVYGRERVTDTGTPRVYAQANFARRFFGVDQYFPGPLGRVYPKHDRILVPCGLWVESPAFKHRHWSGYCGAAGSAWRLRASGGGGRYRYHHNLYRIIDPAKYRDRPEYFPVIFDEQTMAKRKRGLHVDLEPGERYVPKTRIYSYWQPCTTHPDVLRITVETVLAAFAQAPPGHRVFSLGINDSGGFCNCPRCLEVAPPGCDPRSDAANGYRFYRFYNAVAERVAAKYPDARLGFLVYSDLTDWYPEKLHPILMPYMTMSFADCWDEDYRERLYAHIDRWAKIATHFGIYEWYFGKGFMIPRIYLHQTANGLRRAHSAGAEGFYAEAYANWGLDGPKLWVTEKLLWNPEQDVDELVDQWCRGLFAEAAAQMRAYFDYLENAWARQRPSSPRRGGYRLYGPHCKKEQLTEVFPPSVCESAWDSLAKAEAAAEQEIVKKRIAYFKDSFGATRLASLRFHAAERLGTMSAAELAERKKKGKGFEPEPLVDWFAALDRWARLPALDGHMDELRSDAPYAFQEFCQEAVLNRQKGRKRTRYSFTSWDTDAPVLRYLADRTIAEAVSDGVGCRSDLDQRLTQVFAELAAGAKARDRSVVHAIRILDPLCRVAAMAAVALEKTPVIDGAIEEGEWGPPQFDGRFYRYPHETIPSTERTKVWLGVHGQKLYVAFQCHQDPATVLDKCPGRDVFKTRETKRGLHVDVGDGCRHFSYLRDVDSVGVSLPTYKIAIVTSAGGVFDGYLTGYGLSGKWNGCKAKVQRDAHGWRCEIEIDPGERFFSAQKGNRLHAVNFFRVRGNTRSAWVPAAPRRWSVWPRTGGIVFLPEDVP